MQTTQVSAPAQPAKVAELKRSSRQAARAADQSQRAMDDQEGLPSAALQAEASGFADSKLQALRWGRRVHVNRVRGHRHLARPADRFQGWTVSGGVLKPVASRQAPASARGGTRSAPAQGRAFRVEPGLFKPAPATDPKAVNVEPLLLAAAAAKAPEEIAAAFIPRHSRKKVGIRTRLAAVLLIAIIFVVPMLCVAGCCQWFVCLILVAMCVISHSASSLCTLASPVYLLCRAKFREVPLSDGVHQRSDSSNVGETCTVCAQ